jgi:hypothetical protein
MALGMVGYPWCCFLNGTDHELFQESGLMALMRVDCREAETLLSQLYIAQVASPRNLTLKHAEQMQKAVNLSCERLQLSEFVD